MLFTSGMVLGIKEHYFYLPVGAQTFCLLEDNDCEKTASLFLVRKVLNALRECSEVNFMAGHNCAEATTSLVSINFCLIILLTRVG